ncbi:Radical S-adenosyl methionine domain-containing protein 1, mitochondrial [Chionoecetes opilio]|uniref:Radical S-adenosyl methionine domain-containing protein 1, mitochondrial n=1 Tax=Chionoecetes opilio TaxID=41210 RepID=A0A8J4YE40_CHIOP|nr:Radical S-adenosyl methionine domain-containing protein 1, mitochondrial [Chionoecetes opilio]
MYVCMSDLALLTGEVRLPDPDLMADLYTVAIQVLQDAGLYRYEVSNFARHPAAESLHNRGYWQGHQYIGIGPGAHSRVVPQCWNSAGNSDKTNNGTVSEIKTPEQNGLSEDSKRSHGSTLANQVIREAKVNAADPASWLQEARRKGNGARKTECQTRLTCAAEYLASGLRTREGVRARQWCVFLPHRPLWEVFGGEIDWLTDQGLVCLTPEGLTATGEGLAVLDSILPHLYNVLCSHRG